MDHYNCRAAGSAGRGSRILRRSRRRACGIRPGNVKRRRWHRSSPYLVGRRASDGQPVGVAGTTLSRFTVDLPGGYGVIFGVHTPRPVPVESGTDLFLSLNSGIYTSDPAGALVTVDTGTPEYADCTASTRFTSSVIFPNPGPASATRVTAWWLRSWFSDQVAAFVRHPCHHGLAGSAAVAAHDPARTSRVRQHLARPHLPQPALGGDTPTNGCVPPLGPPLRLTSPAMSDITYQSHGVPLETYELSRADHRNQRTSEDIHEHVKKLAAGWRAQKRRPIPSCGNGARRRSTTSGRRS